MMLQLSRPKSIIKTIILAKNIRKDDTVKKIAVVDQKICVACGVCMNACPKGTISVYRGCYAMVEEARCVGCGLCAKACPAGCIAVKERSESK